MAPVIAISFGAGLYLLKESDNWALGIAECATDTSGSKWTLSVVLTIILGLMGFIFQFKMLFDPGFSQFIKSGPHSFFGDAGNALVYEAGNDGVQSKLLGVPAWLTEGMIFMAGSVGVYTCFLTSSEWILLSAMLTTLEAVYFYAIITYFVLVKMPSLGLMVFIVGSGLVGVATWRVETFLKPGDIFSDYYYNWLMALGGIIVLWSVIMIFNAPKYEKEIQELNEVLDYFKENGYEWTDGERYPDGYEVNKPQRFQPRPAKSDRNNRGGDDQDEISIIIL